MKKRSAIRSACFMIRAAAIVMIVGLVLIFGSFGEAFALQYPTCARCNAGCPGTCMMNGSGCECIPVKCLPYEKCKLGPEISKIKNKKVPAKTNTQ